VRSFTPGVSLGSVDSLIQGGRAVVVTATGTFLAMTAFSGPLSIVTAIAADLDAGPVATSWILSSMSLGLAVAMLIAGALGDEVGHRRVFVGGAFLLAVGSAACGLAPGSAVLVAGRIVQGIGSAALVACGLALLSHAVPAGPQRARAAGAWGVAMGVGPTFGPLLGTVSEALSSWRYAYLVMGLLAIALIAATRAWVAEARAARPRGVDLVGAALFGVGVACLLAALTQARQGLAGPAVPVLGALAVGFLAVFVVHQHRASTVMVEPRLFRRPALVSATLCGFVAGAGIVALVSFVSTVLERGTGRSGLAAATFLLAWSVTSVVAAVLTRRLPARLAAGGGALCVGLTVVAVGLVPLALIGRDLPAWQLLLGLFVSGAGTGITNTALGREAVASVPPDFAGVGSGINNTARYVGAAIGVTVVTVLALRPSTDPVAGLIAGWNAAVWLGVALSAVGGVAAVVLERADRRWQHRTAAAAQPS
jgi:MFS family permease